MRRKVAMILITIILIMLVSCEVCIPFFDCNKNGEYNNDSKPEVELPDDDDCNIGNEDNQLGDTVKNDGDEDNQLGDTIENDGDDNDSRLEFELRDDGYYVIGIVDNKLGDLVENDELIIPSIYKGESVVGIADGAFDGIIKYDYYNESSTNGYFTIRLQDGIQFIGKRAFAYCTGLQSVILPSTITKICDDAFRGSAIRSIIIPNSVLTLGEGVFYGCNRLESVELSDSISYITASAFEKCTNLVSLKNTDKILEIGNNAFNGCKKLESFEFSKCIRTIGDRAFCGCASFTSIILPDSLISLGKGAFSSCNGVKELHIGRGINEIPEDAFSYLGSLEKLVIPDHITTINRGAFDGLGKLRELIIPKSVTCFEYCFNDTRNIESIYYGGTFEDWLNISFNTVASSPLYYSSSAKLYLDGTLLEGDIIIPEGITVIPDRAFEGYAYITSISFPHDMKYIGDAAFYGCRAIESVSFGGDVDVFGDQIFYGCKNIAFIDFGSSLSKTGYGMFSCCEDIERLVIPSSVKVIGEYCFSSCNIGELVLSEGIEEIRSAAFAYGSIPEIRLPSTIKILGSVVFWQVCEVYYNGTMEQWEQIETFRWYERYDEYYIHCIDGDIYVKPYYS